ncbi:M23 family metallopeptidase [Desulfuromonas carbonis]
MKRLILFTFIAGCGWLLFFWLRDLTPPTLAVTPQAGAVSAHRSLQIELADDGLGLASLHVTATQGEQVIPLLSQTYPAGTSRADQTLTLATPGLKEGPLQLHLQAVDNGRFPLGKGNVTERTLTLTLDNTPPRVTVLSNHHNFNQGGAGLAVYRLSEPAARTGIQVDNLFFPGFRQPNGDYLCLFAFPWNLAPAAFVPKIVANDEAGNEQTTGIYYHTNPRKFPNDRITISDTFLDNKIVPTFGRLFPEVTNPLELFLKVNRELRQQNARTLHQLAGNTASAPLWQGSFLRQPRAASPGSFAQPRTYYYQGQVIDHQTHLGLDLASTAQAPILAANNGTVIYADELGIYGNCIVIDHGLGLQTLYGHLSRIAVKTGETVQRGQVIGNTGASGLAGGDHLHFDLLVAGTQVNPIEWFDDSWLKNNITAKLLTAGN